MSKVNEKAEELAKNLKLDLGVLEMNVLTNYTLADAIREGSTVTEHEQEGWGDGLRACALTSAIIAGRARGRL